MPTNRPTNRPTSQPTSRPTNQATSQPTATAPKLSQSILDAFKNGGPATGYMTDPASGMVYQAQYSNSGNNPEEAWNRQVESIYGYQPRLNDDGTPQMGVGDSYGRFNLGGDLTGSGAFKDAGSGMDLLATGIITALTMGAGGALLGAAGGATNGGLLGTAGSNFVTGMAGMGGAGGVGSGAGFIGEGALSGIGAWDGALAGATIGDVAGAAAGAAGGALGGDAAGGALGGLKGAGATSGLSGGLSGMLDGLMTPEGIKTGLGLISTVGGAVSGGKGQESEKTLNTELPSHLQGPVGNDLLPRVRGLLDSQLPQTTAQGNAMVNQGRGLLNTPIAGNGVGRVGLLSDTPMPRNTVAGPQQFNLAAGPAMPSNTVGDPRQFRLAAGPALPENMVGDAQQIGLSKPQTPSNPYLSKMADDIQRRTMQGLGTTMQGIAGNSVASGGMGGSRQGVAQGIATSGAMDTLQGQIAGMYGNAYESDSNRALQKYESDQGYALGSRGQDISMRGQDLSVYEAQKARDLSKYQGDQTYALGNRGQDLSRYGMELDSWSAQKGRDVQKYGMDQTYALGSRGQDINMHGMGLDSWNAQKNRDLSKYTADQAFFGQQRQQDQAGAALGAGLVAQGQQAPWNTLGNASDIYAKWFGNGNQTSSTSSGGGWQGALGGLLGGAQFGQSMGWWGSK